MGQVSHERGTPAEPRGFITLPTKETLAGFKWICWHFSRSPRKCPCRACAEVWCQFWMSIYGNACQCPSIVPMVGQRPTMLGDVFFSICVTHRWVHCEMPITLVTYLEMHVTPHSLVMPILHNIHKRSAICSKILWLRAILVLWHPLKPIVWQLCDIV